MNLASGGNDNKLILWNIYKGDMMIKFKEHKAAVKAVEFSPHQNNILLSGGGYKRSKHMRLEYFDSSIGIENKGE